MARWEALMKSRTTSGHTLANTTLPLGRGPPIAGVGSTVWPGDRAVEVPLEFLVFWITVGWQTGALCCRETKKGGSVCLGRPATTELFFFDSHTLRLCVRACPCVLCHLTAHHIPHRCRQCPCNQGSWQQNLQNIKAACMCCQHKDGVIHGKSTLR